MHNVEKVARFNYSATPGIIHLIIMERKATPDFIAHYL